MVLARGRHEGRNLGRPDPLAPERSVQALNLFDRSLTERATKSNGTSVGRLPLPPKTTPLEPPSPAPIPLDLSMSYSLSSACLLYLTTLLTSTNFTSCLPFSLLLVTSATYSTLVTNSITAGNFTELNSLLAYVSSPQPSSAHCDTFMSSALSSISESPIARPTFQRNHRTR